MKTKKKNIFEKMTSGFSLIEMLVTVFIIGIGLVGALSFFSINLNSQFEVKKELIAAGLAQEGLDLVRNIRDFNVLNGKAWDFGLGSCSAIDYRSLEMGVHACSGNGSKVCINTDYAYVQCADPNAEFTRTIAVSGVNLDGSRTVTCEVSWNGRKTSAVDYIYNNDF